jgi:8-oxo-dGTP pyrophosphatase MutT (NUDIX family)
MSRRDLLLGVAIGFALNWLALLVFTGRFVDSSSSSASCGSGDTSIPIPQVAFPEPHWRTPQTLGVRVVASTPFSRCEVHRVRVPARAGSGAPDTIIDDWLWQDERSSVNVLVHLEADDRYLLFEQSKYGLARPMLALVGGLVNPGEDPRVCAARELLEETGLVVRDADLVSLGAYRVQVNRGGGTLYAFLARRAALPAAGAGGKRRPLPPPADADLEAQTQRRLTRVELIDALLRGAIGESKWAAVAALGVLFEMHEEQASRR